MKTPVVLFEQGDIYLFQSKNKQLLAVLHPYQDAETYRILLLRKKIWMGDVIAVGRWKEVQEKFDLLSLPIGNGAYSLSGEANKLQLAKNLHLMYVLDPKSKDFDKEANYTLSFNFLPSYSFLSGY